MDWSKFFNDHRGQGTPVEGRIEKIMGNPAHPRDLDEEEIAERVLSLDSNSAYMLHEVGIAGGIFIDADAPLADVQFADKEETTVMLSLTMHRLSEPCGSPFGHGDNFMLVLKPDQLADMSRIFSLALAELDVGGYI